MNKNQNFDNFDPNTEETLTVRRFTLRNKAFQMGELGYRDSARHEVNRWLWLDHATAAVHNWWLPKYKEFHKYRQWGIEWRRDENEPVVVIHRTRRKASESMKDYVFEKASELMKDYVFEHNSYVRRDEN